MWYIIGEIGQWLSGLAMIGGLVCEIVFRADLFYILLTAGSIFYAVSTKVKYYGANRNLKRKGFRRGWS